MNGNVQMVFWDVQHGHATYIKSPNGRHIVIDLGTGSYDDNNKTFSPLMHLKNNYGVEQLDYVIVTHPHLDHIDDVLNFEKLSPKVFRRPTQITNQMLQDSNKNCPLAIKQKIDKYCAINSQYNQPLEINSPNLLENSDNWGGMKIATFLSKSCNTNNYNNHSIITVIEYAFVKIVVPGDNEKCSFDELMINNDFRKAIKDADVLLAPHHGRESGFHNDFVNLVNPRLTIVSDGAFCDTSANSRYSQKSRGWKVYKKRNNSFIERKCLTTNSDGEVFVEFGLDVQRNPYLSVSTK